MNPMINWIAVTSRVTPTSGRRLFFHNSKLRAMQLKTSRPALRAIMVAAISRGVPGGRPAGTGVAEAGAKGAAVIVSTGRIWEATGAGALADWNSGKSPSVSQ